MSNAFAAGDAGRRGYFERFRAVLGQRLVGNVLHELRNPLNAISLNTDMLALLLAQPMAPTAKLQLRVSVIKERLLELGRRQNALADLWLADPFLAITPERPRAAIERSARLVRDFLSQREVMATIEMGETFDPPTMAMHPVGFELTVVAALLCCGETPSTVDTLRLHPGYDATSGHLSLELDRMMTAGGLAAVLGIGDATATRDAFAALTGAAVEVEFPDSRRTRILIRVKNY